MKKKILILFYLMMSIVVFSNSEIDAIFENNFENNFGIEVNVGLTSLGYPQKVYLKSIGGTATLKCGDADKTVSENEIIELYYRDGKIYFENNLSDEAYFNKIDVLATFAISKDNQLYKNYRGNLLIKAENNKGGILPVNNVQLEEYLYSVVACEIDSDKNEDAVKAQAVAARTYFYKSVEDRKYNGAYDVTDTTMDQVYKGISSEKSNINRMVNDTSGEIITYNDEPIAAFYHGNSGGYTANIEDVWIGSKPMAYLKAVDDTGNWESFPRAAWTYKIPKSELARIMKYNVDRVYVEEKKDNRAKTVVILGDRETKMFGGEFRKTLGYTNLPSTLFDVSMENDYVIISGKGSGHGVGMSQWGAIELAKKGYNYLEILKYYYTGVEIKSVEKTQKYAIIRDNLKN